jgi:hypothetical protein
MTRYDLARDDWAELLAGEQRFRLEQVWQGFANGFEAVP